MEEEKKPESTFAERRRSKLAKTGNFYLKHATKPIGVRVPSMTTCDLPSEGSEGVLFGEMLEQLISTYSPKASPTDNVRLRPGMVS